MDIFKTIRNILPNSWLKHARPIYHGILAYLANIYWSKPSQKLKVIGVTGTAGKSTTINILAHILNTNNLKTGFITTTNYSYGNESKLNKHGLSMPNEWLLQKQLALMVKHNCKLAIVECTSEGLAQNRHLGIDFDMAIFTNLSPAHLEAHGSFYNYRSAKGKLFAGLQKSKKPETVIGVNLDDEQAEFFLNYKATKYFGVSIHSQSTALGKMDIYTVDTPQTEEESRFKIENVDFALKLPGRFNLYNAMLAIAGANELGVKLKDAAIALNSFSGVPGRMEMIPNLRDIKIIVDFACEPKHFIEVLPVIKNQTKNRLIHVFGSTGGHRDTSKRREFGMLSAKYADISIITNDDVYESSPEKIATDIKAGYDEEIRTSNRQTQLEVILDRKAAINYALTLAHSGDTVLFTGKGSEQFLVLPGNKKIDWDEREIIKLMLRNLPDN